MKKWKNPLPYYRNRLSNRLRRMVKSVSLRKTLFDITIQIIPVMIGVYLGLVALEKYERLTAILTP